MRTVIIGAGISGLSAAFRLHQLGQPATVLEREDTVGGLCRSHTVDGFTFDAVSHVLHFRTQETRSFVEDLLDGNLLQQERRAYIYFRERYVPYPFQVHLGFLPFGVRLECLATLLGARFRRGRMGSSENFAEWIEDSFGSGIARHFMKPYNAKLWGVEPAAMSADWVGAFVPKMSIPLMISSLLGHRAKLGFNAIFQYPKTGGIASLARSLAKPLDQVHLNHKVVRLDTAGKRIYIDGSGPVTYQDVISTIPLDLLVKLTDDVPDDLRAAAARLHATRVVSLTYCVKQRLSHDYHWVYYPQPDLPFFRLCFTSNVNPAMAPLGCSIISAEISNPAVDDAALEVETRQALLNLGLIRSAEDIHHVARASFSHGYPVHDRSRAAAVAALKSFYRRHGVVTIGRFGAWHYSSIDDALTDGFDAARDLVHSPAVGGT